MMKTLIAYFSRAGENYFGGSIRWTEVGNTEICAKHLEQMTGADLFRIEMKTPYSDNYKKCTAQAALDMTAGKRPELRELPADLEAYDTIILGYPNYCGTIPMAVASFLEAFDFSGKMILPFCTNEGSGMGKSESLIKKLCPAAEVRPGKSILGSRAEQAGPELEQWLRQNGVNRSMK